MQSPDPQLVGCVNKVGFLSSDSVMLSHALKRYYEPLRTPKRAKDVPHLANLQSEEKGKTRITIMLDNDILKTFRSRAETEGLGYQTLINQVLKSYTNSSLLNEDILRKVIREELQKV